MIEWEAYIHTNKQIQLKRIIWEESSIDTSSPFVMKYLGRVKCNTREEAEDHFQKLTKIWFETNKVT